MRKACLVPELLRPEGLPFYLFCTVESIEEIFIVSLQVHGCVLMQQHCPFVGILG